MNWFRVARYLLALISTVTITPLAKADGWPVTNPGGSVTTGLFMSHTAPNAPSSGDWISSTGGGNTYYNYWVEVPPGATNLVVELFDRDLLAGSVSGR